MRWRNCRSTRNKLKMCVHVIDMMISILTFIQTRREVELHKSQVREFETASGSLQERIATAERELKRLSGILQQIDGLHSELHALEVRKQERLKNRDKLYEMMEVEYDGILCSWASSDPSQIRMIS